MRSALLASQKAQSKALSPRTTINIFQQVMPYNDRFTLSQDDQKSVDGAWFDSQKQLRVEKNDSVLRRCLDSEVDALRAFHDGHTDAAETAHAITRLISTSPVPALGGYSDHALAVTTLWLVIIRALIEWPSARIPDLLELLCAIGKVSDKLHNGEATDGDGEKLTWSRFPWFALTWNDGATADLQPGQIYRQCSNEASLSSARRLYLKIKDIEAQLVAKNILGVSKQMIQNIIRALEKNIDDSDMQLASNEATGYTQVKLDFHIPEICSLFKYNRDKIYKEVVQDGLRGWTPRQIPDEAMEFQDGAERWSFWRKRLDELAQGDFDNQVKIAAKATLEYMA